MDFVVDGIADMGICWDGQLIKFIVPSKVKFAILVYHLLYIIMFKYQHPNYHSHHHLAANPKTARFLPHYPLLFPILAHFSIALLLYLVLLVYFIAPTHYVVALTLQPILFLTVFLEWWVEKSTSLISSWSLLVIYLFTPLSVFSFVLFYLFCSYPCPFPQGSCHRNVKAQVHIAIFLFLLSLETIFSLILSWYPIS